MIRKIDPSEHQIQCAIVEWSTKVFVDHPSGGKVLLRPYLIKIPNEGKRSWAHGKKMKAEGLTRGVSDLFLAIPRRKQSLISASVYIEKCGLWLEIKKKGKKPSPEQCEFLYAMREIGYHADWKDTVDEGIQAIKDYLGMK